MTEPLSGIYVKHRRLTKIREIECVTSKPMEREKKKKWPREELVTRLAGKKEEKEKQTKIMINRKLK